MAFPIVAATNTSTDSSTNSHTVNLPSGIVSGNLLIVAFLSDPDKTITFPAGWTKVYDDQSLNTVQFAVAFRRADGTEGATITVTTSGGPTTDSAHNSYRITGHHTTSDPEASADSGGENTNPDALILTPSWGAEDTLWIVTYGWQVSGTHSAYPTNYSGSQISVNGCASATRDLNATSENPGTATVGSAVVWSAATVGIRPAPAAGAGQPTHRRWDNVKHMGGLRIS